MKKPDNGAVLEGDDWVYYLDGVQVTEAAYREVFPLPEAGKPIVTGGRGGWPLVSDALAVHPSQADEANERNARRGCSVTYDRTDGRAIIPDRAERKKLLKIEGYHDRDGGYGDG